MPRISTLVGLLSIAVVEVTAPILAADSLVVNPAHPTTSDAITFTVLIPWDCCTQYTYDSTASMAGSQILLSCQYNKPQPCPLLFYCPATISLTYKCGRLKAGTYSVYESKQVYCPPGMACVSAIAPVKIGEITVLSSSAVSRVAPMNVRSVNDAAKIYNIKGELVGVVKHNGRNALKTPGVYYAKSGNAITTAIVR